MAAQKLNHIILIIKKEIMKVCLASQIYSISVADTIIKYSRKKLNFYDIYNIQSTENLTIQSNIFDFLNTRNILNEGVYNKPLKLGNEQNIKTFIAKSIQYLQGLKYQNNDL